MRHLQFQEKVKVVFDPLSPLFLTLNVFSSSSPENRKHCGDSLRKNMSPSIVTDFLKYGSSSPSQRDKRSGSIIFNKKKKKKNSKRLDSETRSNLTTS